MEIYIKLFF